MHTIHYLSPCIPKRVVNTLSITQKSNIFIDLIGLSLSNLVLMNVSRGSITRGFRIRLCSSHVPNIVKEETISHLDEVF